MKCENCGFPIDDSKQFCTHCGAKNTLPSAEAVSKIKCAVCGMSFNGDLEICPFCGSAAEACEKENLTPSKKARRKKAIILLVLLGLPIVTAFLIGMYFMLSSAASSNARTYSAEEISEICGTLDFSAITAEVDYYSESIEETYIYDADDDGKKELFMLGYNDLYKQKPVVFAFDTIDNAIMATAVQNGAAGSASIGCNDYYGLHLAWGYFSTGFTEIHYENWSNDGWQEFANAPIDEKTDIQPEDIGRMSHYQLMSTYYDAKNPEDIVNAYNEHLASEWGSNYQYVKKDIDGDGKDEYAFLIADFGGLWKQNLTTTGTDGELMENFIDSLGEDGLTVIYADTDKDGIVFHTFFTEKTPNAWCDENGEDSVRLSWQDGELLVKVINGRDIETEGYFCADVRLSKGNCNSNRDAFDEISKLYVKYLKNHLYTDVLIKYVDICDAEGDELVCICTDSEIDRVNAYAIYCGRIITLYEQDYKNTGAVYLTEKDGKMMLFSYTQRVYGNQHYHSGNRRKNDYRYWLTGFDENYCAYEQGMQYLALYDDETPTAEDNEFFVKLNEYLDVATVCVDRYELTGYKVMPNIETDYSETETGKYLSISNCNINKKGKVCVDENSWLNFRTGPSVSNDKILMDSNDSESFVKQMNGSSVTVIDTANTGDADNPIWVKIQIKYSDKILQGYSSQRYIEIADIKHISVGENFTVEASTNDSGLKWSSNDESVLSVEESSGRVIGSSKGLAIVSVQSDSGLTDSCLIMVD